MPRIVDDFLHRFLKNDSESDDSNIDVPNAILAFRTITTILSHIQTSTSTHATVTASNTTKGKLPKEQRNELRVLDALSAVMVRNHEVVAVMAKPYNGYNVEVVASVNNVKPAFTITQTQNNKSSPGGRFLQWFVAANPRDHGRDPKEIVDSVTRKAEDRSTTLVDPNIPVELRGAKRSDLFNTYLRTQW